MLQEISKTGGFRQPVRLRQPGVCSVAGPERWEPLRVLRQRGKVGPLLLQDAGLGMSYKHCPLFVRTKIFLGFIFVSIFSIFD